MTRPEPQATDAKLLAFLDSAITSWRQIRSDLDHEHADIAVYYIDAFQSVRVSMFGELLPDDQEMIDRRVQDPERKATVGYVEEQSAPVRRIVIEEECEHGRYEAHWPFARAAFMCRPKQLVLDPGSLPESVIEAGARAIVLRRHGYQLDSLLNAIRAEFLEDARACLVAALGETESADG